jgi:pimeloyl-ACP methyl ester carboxylesterase
MPVHRKLSLCLLLGALALTGCQDEFASGPTSPDLAQGSVNPVGKIPGDPRPHCKPTTVPVALVAGQAAKYTIYGQLCSPPGVNPHRVQTVHVAVSGGMYGHLYWAWPYQAKTYSYADALMKAGYAVFTFDRIGIGQSSHPAGASITVGVNAFVVHQLVQGLRSSAIGRTAFERVVLVGHSLGSFVSLAEASTYHDVDGVILTGFGHFIRESPGRRNCDPLIPANQDPRFAGLDLDDAYLTTQPGTRGCYFYHPPVTDPEVVALDEETKETIITSEAATVPLTLDPAVSLGVRVPVLIVNGQLDRGQCGPALAYCASGAAFGAAEAPFFAPEACLQTVVIPNSEHNLNLQTTAPTTYAAISAWSDAYVGLDQAAPPCTQGVAAAGARRDSRNDGA